MRDGKHPLTTDDEMDSEEEVTKGPFDRVRLTMSPDGKRVRVSAHPADEEDPREEYRVGMALINGTPIRIDAPLTISDAELTFQWEAGGLGAVPAVGLRVSGLTPETDEDEPEEAAPEP